MRRAARQETPEPRHAASVRPRRSAPTRRMARLSKQSAPRAPSGPSSGNQVRCGLRRGRPEGAAKARPGPCQRGPGPEHLKPRGEAASNGPEPKLFYLDISDDFGNIRATVREHIRVRCQAPSDSGEPVWRRGGPRRTSSASPCKNRASNSAAAAVASPRRPSRNSSTCPRP